MSLSIVGTTAGSYSFATGALTSSLGNSGTTTVDVQIAPETAAPLLSAAFSPSTVALNSDATLTYTVTNTTAGGLI
ncbi:hypothetical protein [Aestuariicoccus sp. MJ-SS9]|uniref:hypothetical protein n=1 Tax=Aestuariicoccus sp. MJ-SS9 TaxID=3079855 RepID=UPI002911A2CE|nr:hypothetical protein [Aestuariicoccus sp. MJ-SS9]MDU8910048.1 hypothetical protein [Aestuariicoccus sp. MJ-SS9]